MSVLEVYVETAPRRTFACAVDWPGWARGARTEDEALRAFVDYGVRYAAVVRGVKDLALPTDVADLAVVERLEGDSGTDFGIPAKECSRDARPLSGDDVETSVEILRAAWAAFDAAAERPRGVVLRKGPRGGGRDLDKIVEHVLGAEIAYLNQLGGRFKPEPDESQARQMMRVRDEAVVLLRNRAEGYEPPMGRRKAPFWSPRYFVRRSAWHALDHAWEIEDRAQPTG